MNEIGPSGGRPPVRLKTLAWVGVWGASTTLIAYGLSGGSPVRFVIWIVVVAIVVRLVARLLLLRRNKRPPRWWWM